MSLILVIGCTQTYNKVICNNQSVWDERGNFDEFDCEILKSKYPAIRKCIATNYYLNGDEVIKQEFRIICSEEKVACQEGFECIRTAFFMMK